MARGTIFITKYVEKKEIMEDYWYSYSKEEEREILRVYKQAELIFEQEVKVGDAFEVLVRGNNYEKAFVTPMTPPRKDWEAIAWLLGFGKNERASTYREYSDIRERKRKEIGTDDYVESALEGPNFEFAEISLISGGNHEYRNFACFVDKHITRAEIIRLIPEFVYPEPFVRRTLEERFGITEEEFDKALIEFE